MFFWFLVYTNFNCCFSLGFNSFIEIILQLGSTAIGLKTKEGVVLAVEKRITSPLLVCAFGICFPFGIYQILLMMFEVSKGEDLSFVHFQEPSSVEKVMEIDEHIGCAMSGLIADARTLVEHARVETQVIFFS